MPITLSVVSFFTSGNVALYYKLIICSFSFIFGFSKLVCFCPHESEQRSLTRRNFGPMESLVHAQPLAVPALDRK